MSGTEAAAPPPAQDSKPQWLGVSHSDCNKMLQHALNRDPTVKFMVEKMKEVHLLLLPGNCSVSWTMSPCKGLLQTLLPSAWRRQIIPHSLCQCCQGARTTNLQCLSLWTANESGYVFHRLDVKLTATFSGWKTVMHKLVVASDRLMGCVLLLWLTWPLTYV